MLAITELNRAEIENEFMALVLNKNELLDIIQVKPKYLQDKRNQKMLEEILECYRKHKLVNYELIVAKHKDFDFNWWAELYTETFWYQQAWEEQLKLSETSILKFYKEDVIKELNEKLKQGTISYDKFMEKMKQVDEYQLESTTPTLTVKEIKDNIADKTTIELKSYKIMNGILKMVQGDFLIIGATTGAGKSGFMLNLMNDLMDNYQCIYFNMEMSKATIYKRLVSIRANIPVYTVNNPQTFYEQSLITKAMQELENRKIVIEHKATDINSIRSIIIKQKDVDRHTIVFIDHLGLTRVDNKKNLYEQATEVAKQLRQICLEYDCTIISASQLNRGAYASEELSVAMLKDSGELENSASKVILLHKDKDSPKDSLKVNMDIEIAKNRDGQLGFIKMEYDKTKQIFREKKEEGK